MQTTSDKKAARDSAPAAFKNTHNCLNFNQFKLATQAAARAVWLAAYRLEEARQTHEAHGQHYRRLACCIGLAALRLTGGPHHV